MSLLAAGAFAVPLWTVAPFVLLLLAIALLPLVVPHFWHSDRNKAFVAAGLALPVLLFLFASAGETNGASVHRLGHAVQEYISFILLLLALYVVASGIVIRGELPVGPAANVGWLATGAVLANFIGTTGASLVLIRPVLRINSHRRYRTHIPIFFIFVVSNLGGLLTPLGDPPLFLGFLKGIDFFWTLQLWPMWLFTNGLVLIVFMIYDYRMWHREHRPTPDAEPPDAGLPAEPAVPFAIVGWQVNGPLLVGVVLAVLLQAPALSPIPNEFGRMVASALALLVVVGLSWRLTPLTLRHENEFSWGPIIEVAVLFAGIFVTMIPALALLETYSQTLGLRHPAAFYWLTGLLSSLLDNAPTYLAFGTLAAEGNDFAWLATHRPDLLRAIACGAVMMGANTYIGNGPNFMVKAIADLAGYRTPSFFGYMKYSGLVLLPVFGLTTWLFFRG
jgi:Na+/H+ antiporter NhaD/arsenite permease-like protein